MKSIRKSVTVTDVFDIANIIIGMLIVICTVFLFVDLDENEKLFTIVFLLAAIMNGYMAVKYYRRVDVPRMAALSIFTLILLVLTVLSFLTLWI